MMVYTGDGGAWPAWRRKRR